MSPIMGDALKFFYFYCRLSCREATLEISSSIKVLRKIVANITPNQLFANYSLGGSGDSLSAQSVVIPISDLPALSIAEADPSTGDGRELIRSLLQAIYSSFIAIPEASRPNQITATKSQDVGDEDDEVVQTYTFAFTGKFDPNLLTLNSEV